MNDLRFHRPVLDAAEMQRLNEQRERARLALLRRSGACPICERPRHEWPLIFRGDRGCSVNCQKAIDKKKDSQ
jgi:hypothetical protein